jgi:hypothetical protein
LRVVKGEVMTLSSFTPWSLVIGLITIAILWIIYGKIAEDYRLKKLVVGADGRASSSKLQWTLWTIVVLFTFMTVYIARGINGHWNPIQEIPQNALIAMGFSITTMAAAKAITTENVASGQLTKAPKTSGSFLGDIIKDDSGFPDLSKVQMMSWTFIAIITYILYLGTMVFTKTGEIEKVLIFPDIPSALMVLMGLGQGAYIGKKLVTKDTPRIAGLSRGSGKAGTEIKITGESFGNAQSGSLITIDGNPITVLITEANWKDSQITFTLPDTQPTGAPWNAGMIRISLIVNGRASNDVPFTINTKDDS